MNYDLADYLCPANGKPFLLDSGENCQSVRCPDGWIEFRKNRLVEEFAVDEQFIYRGADTSLLYTPDNLYHGTFYVQYTHNPWAYGAPWAKRRMEVGETFHRTCDVVTFDWQGNVLRRDQDVQTDLLLEKHFNQMVLAGGPVDDVLMLRWGGEEAYFYARGYGLVGWRNLATNTASWLISFNALPFSPVRHPLTRPVKDISMTPMLREDLGEPVEGVIDSLRLNWVNVRSMTTDQASILGQLHKGDKLTFRPKTLRAGNYNWYAIEAPWVGWMADVATPVAGAPEKPTLKLNVPYCSQLALDAAAFNNDCGPACLLMLMRYWRQVEGWGYGNFPTVDDVARHTKLSDRDTGLNPSDLVEVTQGYGNQLSVLYGMTPDRIIAELRLGSPVGVLVNYGDFNPKDGFKGGHYAVITGYNDRLFWAHDPYHGGQDYTLPRSQLDAALKNTAALIATPYVGFILS